MLTAYAGTDPSTQQKIRWADEQELELRVGAWIDPELLAFLRQVVVALDAG